MNPAKLLAFVLIALGVMAFVYRGLIDTSENTASWAAAAGAIAFGGGIVVLVIDRLEISS